MSNELSEMTNEELWQLFSIILSKHNPVWKVKYLEEKALLKNVVGKENIARMNHYGRLKIELGKEYEHDRDVYTKAKTDFIKMMTQLAREEFGNKY